MILSDVHYKPNGISVVIPNYNGVQLFQRTLAPLFDALNQAGCEYEVILVDDCSTDDSLQYITSNYPQIKILHNEVNSGFSKTINKGIFEARLELIFLLNSDIILTKDYFQSQFKYFSFEDTFGVMGRIIGWDDEIIQDAARYPDFHGVKIKTSHNYVVKSMAGKSLYTLYLSGANALVSRNKLHTLKGFDEIYSPFYIEDCDLSFRAWRMGWKCYYEHQAICRHKTSVTIRAKNKKQFVELMYNRNKLFLHAIHLNSTQFVIYLLQICIEALFKALIFKPTLLKSLRLFAKNNDQWQQSKRNFNTLQQHNKATLSLNDVTSLIKESLSSEEVIKFYSGKLKETI